MTISSAPNAPPPFAWEEWYAAAGGRPVPREEVTSILRAIREDQLPRFDGPVASVPAPFPSPDAAATWIKATARELGADLVGICMLDEGDVYRGRSVEHTHAIAVGMRMSYTEFQRVPDGRSAVECLRIYHDLGEVVIGLANELRARGIACRVEHPIGDSDVLHIPIGLKAGFGELGRHGSIINPTLGPLFRMGSVLLSIDVACDAPIDAGIGAFCDSCRACRLYCPADAIPDERSPEAGVDHCGNARYVVDTGKCFSYFAKHDYCSACLPVCVYNHRDWAHDFTGLPTQNFPTVIMADPPPPVDAVPDTHRHAYPHVHRDRARPPKPRRAL